VADRGEDGADHRAGDGRLGQLEGDRAGLADDTRPDLGQLQLQAGEGPTGGRSMPLSAFNTLNYI
jgi:hypothetical protein